MGELIFTFAYGSSLIVLGFITKICINRMEKATKTVPETVPQKKYKEAM